MAENVWEQWPVSKNFLTDLEGNTKILSILRIGEFNFISFEVLLNTIFIISLNLFEFSKLVKVHRSTFTPQLTCLS